MGQKQRTQSGLSGDEVVCGQPASRSDSEQSSESAVVSYGELKSHEFTTHGILLQNIQLQSDCGKPWNAIDMANGQFVVSCTVSVWWTGNEQLFEATEYGQALR